MNIFGNENEKEREIGSRTSFLAEGEREVGQYYTPDLQTERVVACHLGHIEEVQKQGDYRSVFRYGEFEYRTLAAAVRRYINILTSGSSFSEPSISGETREKTRSELSAELSAAIFEMENEVSVKLSAALQRPGTWHETLILPVGNMERSRHAEEEGADLRKRLVEVFGSPLLLLVFLKANPGILKIAIENLPAGQSEEDLLAERRAMLKRDEEAHKRRILEAREFLRKLK